MSGSTPTYHTLCPLLQSQDICWDVDPASTSLRIDVVLTNAANSSKVQFSDNPFFAALRTSAGGTFRWPLRTWLKSCNNNKSSPSSNTILPDSASHSVVGASSLKQGLPHANVISSGQGNARGSSNTHTPYTQQHSSMYGAQNTYAQHPSGNSYAQGYQAATNNTSSQVDKKPKKKKEKRFSPMGFRPPKHKPETRD